MILIGELRDAETAQTALQAAESGHLVLSTLHTVDAAETIGRMVEFFPEGKQQMIRSIMAGVLRGVVSQRLLPRIDGGRIAAVEVMVTNTRIADLIRENQPESITDAIEEGSFFDMQSFSKALIDLVVSGKVDREVAANAATNRHDFLVTLEHALKQQKADVVATERQRRPRKSRPREAEPRARARASDAPSRPSRRLMRLLVVAAIGLALLAGSARAAGPPVLGFSVSSGAQPGLARVSLPSASVPNSPGSISIPVSFTSAPLSPQQVPLSTLHVLWQQAGSAYGIPWQVLASINKIESNFGQNMGPSSAGAVGWMQFMPSTWLRWGVDADGDGIADPWNATDAIYAAARYLAAAGGQTDIARGVFAYNHADWYVREVLDLAGSTARAGSRRRRPAATPGKARRSARRRSSAPTSSSWAQQDQSSSSGRSRRGCIARVDAAALLSDRLAAEQRAILYDVRVDAAGAATDAARASLEAGAGCARDRNPERPGAVIRRRRRDADGSGLRISGDYVFPVGGGPQLVSVAHTHHDYPAADIAAPAGLARVRDLGRGRAQRLALRRSALRHRHDDPHHRTVRSGRTATSPTWIRRVMDGVSLAAGAQVGLVGSTGHATGPHLHLQLQPADVVSAGSALVPELRGHGFPLAGRPDHARVARCDASFGALFFSVVPDSRDAVIGFTLGGA